MKLPVQVSVDVAQALDPKLATGGIRETTRTTLWSRFLLRGRKRQSRMLNGEREVAYIW